jgi:flavin-dependent dehydrogenase
MIAVGDAAGMIDPFTGTGIQIALRGGETLAECVILALSEGNKKQRPGGPAALANIADQVRGHYETRYEAEFGRRMAVAGALRLAAFTPRVAELMAGLFANAPGLVNKVFRWTRLSRPPANAAEEPGQVMELSAPDGVSGK